MLDPDFFNRDPQTVAKNLIGKVICHSLGKNWLKAMIVETEAYYLEDKASHASLGFTEKRKALFMPAGTIYMYYARGGDSLNVSCRGEGNAVLIKSGIPYTNDEKADIEMLDIMLKQHLPLKGNKPRPLLRLCSGQTLLCRSLGLKVPEWNQKTFDPNRFYIEDIAYIPKKIIQTTRLGIPKGRDEHLVYRFIDYNYAAFCTKNPLTRRNKKKTLSRLNILITRPAHQAKHLCEKIEALGGHCILYPTIRINVLIDQPKLTNIDKAIFVSANAVYPVMPYLAQRLSSIPVFAVGSATAKALASFNIKATTPTENKFCSEGLLALNELQSVENQHIAIFSGTESRSLLSECLIQRGAKLQQIFVYERIPLAQDFLNKLPLWQEIGIDLIVVNSHESLKNLWTGAGKVGQVWLREQQLIVINAKMKEAAKELGFVKSAIVADNATDEAIIDVLTRNSH